MGIEEDDKEKNLGCCIHRNQNLICNRLFAIVDLMVQQPLWGRSWEGKESTRGVESTVSLISSWVSGLPSLALPIFWTLHIWISTLLSKSWLLLSAFTPCISTSSPLY